jgi:hypothetical protein
MVFHHGGWQKQTTVEVGQHPLGTGLGTVNGDNAEVVRAHGLDPRRKNATWFANMAAIATTTRRTTVASGSTHEWTLQKRVMGGINAY